MHIDNPSLREQLNWPSDDPRWSQLNHFLERVRTAGVNLVSSADREQLSEKHVLPSLEALPWIPDGKKVMDVGSGGGFPALVLAFARLYSEFLLIESSERKTEFLTRVSRETCLSNVRVVCSRVEKLITTYDAQFDIITAKAVAELPDLICWTKRFLNPNGYWVLWKGSSWKNETTLSDLGVCLVKEHKLSTGGRLLILKEKQPND